ncbi:helix-turn-helix domain-containing protein, partial [Proteus mirabilis]|uniref:helix-turn-helix domain-containing protein n=1 Tax=Proteus mirabilis TaxID=584 RepID=UPI001952ADE2
MKPTFAIQNTNNLPHNDAMKSKEAQQTPAIQVLERMFALLDVLASHQDPVSLKALSEATGLH